LTDRRTIGPHDYFFSGRPSHADEAQMLEQIAAAPPPLAVTLNDRLGYFSALRPTTSCFATTCARHYALVRRIGRYDILLRRDLTASRPHLAEARFSGGPLSAAFASGEYRREVRAARRLARIGAAMDLDGSAERLADVDRLVRRARLRAIIAVAERTPGGLAAVEPIVAPDRRSRLLFLRALGEFGDAKALTYLRQVYADGLVSDARLEREAATAVNFILARELASRYGWSRAEDGPLWSLPADLLDDRLVVRLGDFDGRQRIGALVAFIGGRRQSRRPERCAGAGPSIRAMRLVAHDRRPRAGEARATGVPGRDDGVDGGGDVLGAVRAVAASRSDGRRSAPGDGAGRRPPALGNAADARSERVDGALPHAAGRRRYASGGRERPRSRGARAAALWAVAETERRHGPATAAIGADKGSRETEPAEDATARGPRPGGEPR
jgi:hypothetical protein